MEQNEIGFITVAICGGYIGKYPRLELLHIFKHIRCAVIGNGYLYE